MSGSTVIALFIDSSIRGKQMLLGELNRLLLLEPDITDIFIEHSFPYKSGLKTWAQRNGIGTIHGIRSIGFLTNSSDKRLVVYVGFNQESYHFRAATNMANELNCELILMP